ncbi:glutathione S-transferase N-terminal domain-containing protein [Bradyrhizobium retamae]|uniref:glutathione S-transferase family protein n=1 Tax=Bradyrhizobium retamae TaxID=1300035 RepID=UPI0009E7DC06
MTSIGRRDPGVPDHEPRETLYEPALSYAHRVRLTLAEKGIDAEPIEIDLRNKPSDFVHISPDGRIPLVARGCENLPDPPLMPAAPADRARNWIKLADEQLYSTTHRFIFTREAEARRELAAQLLETMFSSSRTR